MFNYLIVHIDVHVANWEPAVRTVRVAMEWAPLILYCAVAVLSCPGAPLTPQEVVYRLQSVQRWSLLE